MSELTYESDEAATATSGKTKETAKEKAARILREAAEKDRQARAKEKEKAKAAQDRQRAKEKAQAEKEKAKAKAAQEKEKAKAKAAQEKEKAKAKAAQEKEKAKQQSLALKTNLTDEEAVERKQLEKQVEKNLADFQSAAFEIGAALCIINQKRLYRDTHKTFGEYVRERFDLSEPHAYSVMSAARTFEALTEGQKFNAKDLPSIRAAEAISSGVQKLLKEAGLDKDAEVNAVTRQVARNVYNLAVQDAPINPKTGKPDLSPAHIQSTFSVLSEVARTGLLEVDGEQVPVTLAATTIDEMITTESAERAKRAKAYLVEQIRNREALPAPSKVAQALDALSAPIPDNVTPKLTCICSVHGRAVISKTDDTHVELECGCEFVAGAEGYVFTRSTKTA